MHVSKINASKIQRTIPTGSQNMNLRTVNKIL